MILKSVDSECEEKTVCYEALYSIVVKTIDDVDDENKKPQLRKQRPSIYNFPPSSLLTYISV